jgi:DNA-binding Lrp family transcriptional regulator
MKLLRGFRLPRLTAAGALMLLASMAQYESLTEEYFTADPAVKRVDSLIVMKAVKGRHELFVPRSDTRT